MISSMNPYVVSNASKRPSAKLSSIRTSLTEYKCGIHTYRAGKCAEMVDGSFLRIRSMAYDLYHMVWLKGDRLVRAASVGMPDRLNELVWVSTADDLTMIDQPEAQEERCLLDALRPRRVNFTNQPWVKQNTAMPGTASQNADDDINSGKLFCRLRDAQTPSISQSGGERIIRLLHSDEADERYRVDERDLRAMWRDWEIIPGGGHSTDQQIHNLDGPSETVRVQKYTLGDCFCGGGGVTRGACMAGLHPVFGFDYAQDAINTYRANFESVGTMCHHAPVDVFIKHLRSLDDQQLVRYLVDILHLSPVCKTYSPAYTTPNDETREHYEATLFAADDLLARLQPRVVTLEETFGLLFDKHALYFSALVKIFVDQGYSVRYKNCNLEEWGVPQTRRRLLFLAAAPGETLPAFPPPTHGPGLKKPVSIQDTLNQIPPQATRQETSTGGNWPKDAYSADGLAKTFTCNKGQGNYHPSGTRDYTIREMSSLQTFPWFHDFPGTTKTAAVNLIGNAVPPLAAKVVFCEIIKTLKETDGFGATNDDHPDVMVLD